MSAKRRALMRTLRSTLRTIANMGIFLGSFPCGVARKKLRFRAQRDACVQRMPRTNPEGRRHIVAGHDRAAPILLDDDQRPRFKRGTLGCG